MNNDRQDNKITRWGGDYLASHGYTLISNLPETVQNTPWSYVVRFTTSHGYIYLKQTPALLALEASILPILHDQFHVSVPEVIAHNNELHCFLMKDAGRPLREILKQQFDVALFCKAIEQFTSMQLVVADHVKIFLNVGVPDWRLDKLPHLYMQLLSQKEILIADGLSEKEWRELEELFPKVSLLCQKLSEYAIKPSVVQPDFNDNNTLINQTLGKITFIDLGEITISHPFFSLINCLRQAQRHHTLKDEDERYLQLRDACLKKYMNRESKQNLLDALATANILFFAYGALCDYRLVTACDKERFTAAFRRHGRPSISLRAFITECHALDKGLSDFSV